MATYLEVSVLVGEVISHNSGRERSTKMKSTEEDVACEHLDLFKMQEEA